MNLRDKIIEILEREEDEHGRQVIRMGYILADAIIAEAVEPWLAEQKAVPGGKSCQSISTKRES